MTPIFFQQFWNIVKGDLIAAISSFFHSGNLLKSINETVITLIPKVDAPILVSQFRPISLCNVIYRVISKILVNRLKPFLKYCISSNQSAFIPGRQILDNEVIAHEFIHCLHNRRTGTNTHMALKLDMSKAYDRIERVFLAKVMQKMGVCPKWIQWIMKCVSSVTYTFNINGEKNGYVKPTRGLQQGDFLSPYLLVIISEGFSSLLQQAMQCKRLTGLKIAQYCPAVSHLFFADDTLIFCKVIDEEARKIMHILSTYGAASGQMINVDKSVVFFSKNTRDDRKNAVLDMLVGMKEVR